MRIANEMDGNDTARENEIRSEVVEKKIKLLEQMPLRYRHRTT